MVTRTEHEARAGDEAVRLPGLFDSLRTHRAALIENVRTVLGTAWGGRDPAGIDPASLDPVREGPIRVSREQALQFLAATRGLAQHFDRRTPLLLPPTIAATWTLPMLVRALRQARLQLPFLRVLHAGNAVEITRYPTTDDEIYAEGRIVSLDVKPSRTLLTGRFTHRDAAGAALFTIETTLFFPGPGGDEGRKDEPRPEPPRVAYGATELTRLRPRVADARGYASVAGDFNPVHLSDTAARASGFPGSFLHGYAVKAILAHTLIGTTLGGDPRRLRRLAVRFRRPVFAGRETGLYVVGPAAVPEGERYELLVGPGPGELAQVTGELIAGA